jgi:hypothetical protein
MGPETVALTASQLDPVSDAPSDETMRRMGFRRHDQGGRNGSNNSKSTHRAPRDAGDAQRTHVLLSPGRSRRTGSILRNSKPHFLTR